MFSRLSGIANTVLHELSGDGEGSEHTRDPDPGPEIGPGEGMSEDQMERLAHYEQLVVQLKDLIQQKDVEIQRKDAELQQKESQIKSEREASDTKFTKLKLQAKAKVTTLNKQIEELKKTAVDQGNQGESEDNSNGKHKSSKSVHDNEETNLQLQDNLNELTRQLQESQSNISALTKQLSESQETIASLTKQLQDSQDSGLDLKKSLHEREDAAKRDQEMQELERTLEEKNEALHSRDQVVEMLEQELQSAELQKRVLSEQFREMEQELISLRESLVIEQKESSQQAKFYKDVLEEKSILCQQLQQALDKEKEVTCEMENLKSQFEKANQQLDATSPPGLGQIQVESDIGAQEELEILRAELEKEKGAQEALQQLREELEKERGAQEELQHLKEELEKEKVIQEEFQQLKEELDKEKGAQEELQQLREELQKEKGVQEELQQLREELQKEKDAQEELQELREELVKGKGAQKELQQLREELVKEKGIQDELQQLRDELKKERGAQVELQKLKEQHEKINVEQEPLKQVNSELEQQKETQKPCQVELEKLNEELLVETKEEQGAYTINESGDGNKDLEGVQMELEIEHKRQEELTKLKEELKRVKESLKEFDHVKEEIERGQKMLSELEMMKQEMQIMREAQSELNKLQVEQQHVKEQVEQSGMAYTYLSGQGLTQEEPRILEKEETTVSLTNLNTQHYTVTTGEDSNFLSSPEVYQESVVSHQKLQSTVLNVQTSSVSQELVLNVASEDLKEKQLSILMMDLLDTQEEINRLKGELPVEGNVNECSLTDQAIEKNKNVSIEDDSQIQMHDLSNLTSQDITVNKDDEILLMKNMVAELQSQIGTITSEREQISLKLEALQNKEDTIEVSSTYELLESEKQQLTTYESQNILVEQVKSLENESKSKDLKIIALQKDLDHMSLLLSEKNELSKLQVTQLEKKEQHIGSLNEILGLSQNKEERLSEELATNEREKVSLQELLSQKITEIQDLQESIIEKDRQVEEISHSLSDKVVLLNEEKYSMTKEIKSLKEQLNTTIQDQNGMGEELIQTLRTENIEIHLQIENVTKEKCHLQEMFESVQSEFAELNRHLETTKLSLVQNQEMVKIVQEEREILQMQLQDQKCGLLKKEKEYEELQIQLDIERNDHVQELQLLIEKQQNSLEVINGLQGEKCILESQLQSYISKSEQDAREVGLKESNEHQTQLEGHKKEIEQLKRKLQAALTSRKELNRKISKLEKEMVNSAVNQDKDFTGNSDVDVQSFSEEICEQNITDDCLKKQLSERESDLEIAQKELAEKSAANEQYQKLIDELTLELKDKSRQIDFLKTEQTESISAETPVSHAVDQEARIRFENKITTLEEEKEILQKKVQEVLNSRRDTIKKAQEKDRHHREQLKQHKEDFNLLLEKYEQLQLNQKSHQINEVIHEESGTQTMRPGESQYTNTNIFEDAVSMNVSDENAEDSHWGTDWVDFSSANIENPAANKSAILDLKGEDNQMQMEVFQSQKNELEFKALQLEEKLSSNLEEISHMQNSMEQLNRDLQAEKEKNVNLEIHASTLKAEMESSNQTISQVNEDTIGSLKEELMQKVENIGQLHKELEVVNGALKSADMLLAEKDDTILSLQTQVEVRAKEHEELHRKLEVQSLESQSKLDEEVEEAKGKQQLQRKLQAALISRKEALKENKTLKLELYTVSNLKADLSNRLQNSEDLVNQLSVEKESLLKTLSAQNEERDKIISEIDKHLLENQNLVSSCESLKLALTSMTQDKEDLGKEMESIKLSQNSEISEWQEKLTDLQKEYETLLQSYENVSNEIDRMKRALETVRQEKQELFSKIKSVETEKKDVEKQLEESEQEIENMKEKMRKFAKSKQQKILELEEENDRLRGELQPVVGVQHYDSASTETSKLKEELDKLHSENHSLLLQLQQAMSEKDGVMQEIESLRLQLHNVESIAEMSVREPTSEIHEEVLIKNEIEVTGSQLMGAEEQQAYVESAAEHKITQPQEALEEDSKMKELIQNLEYNAKIKQNEIERLNGEIKVLIEDKLNLETQLKDGQSRVTKMEIEIVQLEKKHQLAVGDLDEVSTQKRAIELEKDELEERLMNQMAELNGSIGNFQQDAMDLEVKNDSLQRDLENLKLQLEEEKRVLERQKIDALSEAQKEYVEKLKSASQSAKGRKTQSKELQELLKEKQQEVRHLQKDCIHYQETISGLERTIKALEFDHNNCEKEKLISNDKVMKATEDTNKAQNDLASFRVLLDDTQSEAARVLAENQKLKDEMRTIAENTTVLLKMKEEDLEKRLHIERDKHMKQVMNLQEKINLLQQEKDHLEGSIVNLQSRIREKDKEMKDLQGELNQNIAKLAAFTRSMCSLQNDRDRVIEESKEWSEKLTDAMHKKDTELNDKEKVCVDLKNELIQITTQLEELKAEVTRIHTENKELVTRQQTESEVYLKTRDSLLEEKAILSSSLEEECKNHSACLQELKLRTQEANDRHNQLEALEIKVNQIKSENENLLEAVKRLETEVQNWKLHNEQIQSDLQASKSLTEQLHTELEQKEQDVVQLLNSRDEAVSTAVGELQDVHAIECKNLQDRLKETEKETLDMQDKLKKIKIQLKVSQEEVGQSKGQLDSFTKSMCSLQEERERVLGDYQQLEQRHLDAILAKDGLIQEAAAESNKLREELRLLRSRTDDLNAQNAKLNAQLTRYREDLKELISLKDSQLKQLLGEKLQEIERLRHDQNNQEQQLIQEKGQREILQQELDVSKLETQKMLEEIDNLKLYVSQLQIEMGTQGTQLEQDKQEMQNLKDELIKMQTELTHLQEESSRIQVEAEQRVQHAEDELNKKVRSMQHDTGVLRNETETASERVAELARDLMESEQRLLTANEEISGLKAQLQAFGGSMRSLQDSHDLAQEETQRLQEQLTEVTVLNTQLNAVNTEKDRLNAMLSESKEQQYTLEMQLNDITNTLQSREEEMSRITSELHTSQTQLQDMSKAMTNLQENNNRLQSTLKAPRKEIERRLQSPSQKEAQISSNEVLDSVEELQKVQTEVQNLNTQLSESLTQVHHKELRIQQLNSKLSQIFEEKNTLSLQLRGSNQHLRDATSRCSSLERQLQELQQKNLEALPSDSAPGAPQEKKEPQTETDQQLQELHERYLEVKKQNTEQEQVRSVLEQQLREERQRSECRIQELEQNLNMLRSHDWSAPQDHAPHEMSLLIETHGTASVKTRSSSLRRFLRFLFCSRTKAPLLFSVYLLLIHALLFLCFTGHL